MNQAIVEIARILLEFEIEKRQAAAASQVPEAQDAATAERQVTEATRPGHYATRRHVRQTEATR